MSWFASYATGVSAMLAVVLLTMCRYREPRDQMLRTAAAILCNWLAGTAYVSAIGDYTPWMFNIVIDMAAAVAVMRHPAGRVQGFIGLFYCSQIAWHVAFGIQRLMGYNPDGVFYYHAITWIAWAQLVAMGVWSGAIWIGDFVHHLRHRRDADPWGAGAGTDRRSL